MRFLILMIHLGVYRVEGDYRSRRLVHASPARLALTILALAAGAALWWVAPGLRVAALAVMIAAAAYLTLLVVGGIAVSLLMMQQRTMIRRKMLESIPWRGTEKVLDVGCGSGMMLNGCAQRLTSGQAVGVDLWEEEVGGTADLLMANARAEGVADKVELRRMDARHLTFEDTSFDVVVSSLALHHIVTSREDLQQTIQEMIRVLAPGGSLALVDAPHLISFAEGVIKEAGLEFTLRENSRFFRFVSARKAPAAR